VLPALYARFSGASGSDHAGARPITPVISAREAAE
jgi:hypothetical protein